MQTFSRAQSGVEQLLIIGAAILVVAVVILALSGAVDFGSAQTKAPYASGASPLDGLKNMFGVSDTQTPDTQGGFGGGTDEGTGDNGGGTGDEGNDPQGPVTLLGNGTQNDPWIITDCNELQSIKDTLDGYYVLGNNIDCSPTYNWNFTPSYCSNSDYNNYYDCTWNGDEWINIGYAGFIPIGNGHDENNFFNGNFDGNGKVISNLYINRPTSQYVGLFGYVSSIGSVKRVLLQDHNIFGGISVGALVASNHGSISKSAASGGVSGENYVGGLVGYNYGPISEAFTSGITYGNNNVGGIAGTNAGSITNSHSANSPRGTVAVGGLAGENDGLISNSYHAGISVIGYGSEVGGLVGYMESGSITNSFAAGFLSGVLGGGIVGIKNDGTITNTYWDMNRTGAVACCGGLTHTGIADKCTQCYAKNENNTEPDAFYLKNILLSNPPHFVYDYNVPIRNNIYGGNDWDFNIWNYESNFYPLLKQFTGNQIPIVDSVTAIPNDVNLGYFVHFTASAHDNDGSVVSYTWQFGDGNVMTTVVPEIYYDYKSAGTFEVRLVVTDNKGASSLAPLIPNATVVVRSPSSSAPTEVLIGDVAGIEGGGIQYVDLRGNTIKVPFYVLLDMDNNVPRAVDIAGKTYTFWPVINSNLIDLFYTQGNHTDAVSHNGWKHSLTFLRELNSWSTVTLNLGIETANGTAVDTNYVFAASYSNPSVLGGLVLQANQTFRIKNPQNNTMIPSLNLAGTKITPFSQFPAYLPNNEDFLNRILNPGNSALGQYNSNRYISSTFIFIDNNSDIAELYIETGDTGKTWDANRIFTSGATSILGPNFDANTSHWYLGALFGQYITSAYTYGGSFVDVNGPAIRIVVKDSVSKNNNYFFNENSSPDCSSLSVCAQYFYKAPEKYACDNGGFVNNMNLCWNQEESLAAFFTPGGNDLQWNILNYSWSSGASLGAAISNDLMPAHFAVAKGVCQIFYDKKGYCPNKLVGSESGIRYHCVPGGKGICDTTVLT